MADVRTAFIDNLDTLKWMDKETRTKARDKAQAVHRVVGYPEWLLDPIKLDNFYQKVGGMAAVAAGFVVSWLALSKPEWLSG